MVVQAGIRIAVHAGEQAAGIEEQFCIGAEVIELGFVILEIHVHFIEQTCIVARADLQVGVDVVLAHHRGKRAGFIDLEEAAHIIELIHQCGIDFFPAVGALQKLFAGKHIVFLFPQMNAGAVHLVPNDLFIGCEHPVKVDRHGRERCTDFLCTGKGEIMFKLHNLADHQQAVSSGQADPFFKGFRLSALRNQADGSHKTLLSKLGIVSPGEGDHLFGDCQFMRAVPERLLEHHVAVTERPSGRCDLNVKVQLPPGGGEPVENHMAVIRGKAFRAETAAGIGPHGGDHAVLHVQPAQVIPGFRLLWLIEFQPECSMQSRGAGGVENLVVKIHVFVETGFFLSFIDQCIRFLGPAFKKQFADPGKIRTKIRGKRSLLPQRFIQHFLCIADFFCVGTPRRLQTQFTIAGDEIIGRLFCRRDGADVVLGQNANAFVRRNISVGVFKLGKINHNIHLSVDL